MAEILGTSGDDTLPGTRFGDAIHGGDGNDHLNAVSAHNMVGAGNDTLYGGNGDDTLLGGNGDDLLFGEAGNDSLAGGDGTDTLHGGAGDDLLSSGGGRDLLIFNFSVGTVTSYDAVSVRFRDGHAPDPHADFAAWQNYSRQLDAWRAALEDQYGADQDTGHSFDLEVAVHGNSAPKPATETVHLSGDDSFTYLVPVTRTAIVGEGNDTVLDWSAEHDALLLNGLSNDSSAQNYWGDWLYSEAVADGRTVISYEGGSITLVGIDTTLTELVAQGDLYFA